MTANPWLVCGIAGTRLSHEEKQLLVDLQPAGIILFARNLRSPVQAQQLVAELRDLPSSPFVCIDLEGGPVNRLRALAGELPGPSQVSALGEEGARLLGAVCGALCAALGIGVDLAPVLDVAGPGSYLGGEGRCWGEEVETVASRARAFLQGLESFGVRGCLKHYPGLGSGQVDSHRELPLLGDEVGVHRRVFFALASPERAVMVAHALVPSLGEALAPASLSPQVVGAVPAGGPIFADDVEMGALSEWGSLGERAAAALVAGCHFVLLCNALEERKAVAEHVQRWAERDALLAQRLCRAQQAAKGFGQGPLRAVSWAEAMAMLEELRELARVGR